MEFSVDDWGMERSSAAEPRQRKLEAFET